MKGGYPADGAPSYELFATTSVRSQRLESGTVGYAIGKAAELGLRFVDREGLKDEVAKISCADALVFLEFGVRLDRFVRGEKKASLKFHPSTASLRIQALKAGRGDVMADAMGIRKADSILDCTMGLGADALTAAWAAGDAGGVTALEASRPMFLAIDLGMEAYNANLDVMGAISRVKRLNASYRDFLRACPDSSYDVVYMDPMFQAPVAGTPIDALRAWAVEGVPSGEDLAEAVRVARRRLVVKLRKGERIEELYDMAGFAVFHSSKAGSVHYVGVGKDA